MSICALVSKLTMQTDRQADKLIQFKALRPYCRRRFCFSLQTIAPNCKVENNKLIHTTYVVK